MHARRSTFICMNTVDSRIGSPVTRIARTMSFSDSRFRTTDSTELATASPPEVARENSCCRPFSVNSMRRDCSICVSTSAVVVVVPSLLVNVISSSQMNSDSDDVTDDDRMPNPPSSTREMDTSTPDFVVAMAGCIVPFRPSNTVRGGEPLMPMDNTPSSMFSTHRTVSPAFT